MSRLMFAALILFSATPVLAGTAQTTMSVGVTVVYDPLPPAPVAQPAPPPSDNSAGH